MKHPPRRPAPVLAAAAAAALGCTTLLLAPPAAGAANKREEDVRKDKAEVVSDGYWLYDNLEAGMERAREADKPLLVVLRCIP